MSVDTVFAGGILVTSHGMFQANLEIRDGRIAIIGDSVPKADRTIDATGKYIFQGVVDPHTHIKGYYSQESYETATAAAAMGDITTCINFAWQSWANTGSGVDQYLGGRRNTA